MSELPDLSALRRNESVAWDQLFDWLYPIALSAAEHKLRGILPNGDAEDVAVQAIETLVPKIHRLNDVKGLLPLVVSIAHCLAVDRVRHHLSKKQGGGNVQSLDDKQEEDGTDSGSPRSKDHPDKAVHERELARLVSGLMESLKPPARRLLSDFFLHGKKYEELSADHGLATNSIGVYLKRGLDTIRNDLAQQPKLADELRLLLTLPARAMSMWLFLA